MERRFAEIEITPQLLRQMQAVQLEILVEVDRICRLHDIRYSLDGGTLLGAARHKGFIPWDDDIDLIMLRADYERFFAVCRTALDQKRFFLQEHRTDPHYSVGYPRVRRNHSVYLRAGHEHLQYHSGVFIDLFVLDNVPDNWLLRRLHGMACFALRKALWAVGGQRLHPRAALRLWYAVLARIPRAALFRALDALKDVCNRAPTRLARHMTHPYPREETCRFGIPAALMEAFTELEFEGRKFPVIQDYDRYLTLLYGDYRRLPPPAQRRPHIHLAAFAPPPDF